MSDLSLSASYGAAPLSIQKDGTWYCYGWDLTKNICEVFGQAGYIRTTYFYSPYGSMTEEGDVTQPLQWSSEYADPELDLVYYNYRSYNPTDGRWIRRDPYSFQKKTALFVYVWNKPTFLVDHIGMKSQPPSSDVEDKNFAECVIVNVFIYVRKWLFLSEKYQWQPGRDNSVAANDKTPYQYPTLILEAKWKDSPKCRSLLNGCYEIPNVNYLVFLLDGKGNETKKTIREDLTSYTLLGRPAREELSMAHAVGNDAIGVGRVSIGLGRQAVGVRVHVWLGLEDLMNSIYYL